MTIYEAPCPVDDITEHWEALCAAQTVLSLTHCAMNFAGIKRVPRYDRFSRENDAEHSYMLGLVATELAKEYYPGANDGLITQFSIVHDLVELDTGDVATYTLGEAELRGKADREHTALLNVVGRLPRYTGELLLRYEAQAEFESRFVRHVDKALPVAVDILGPGRQVMTEDYGIRNRCQLDAAEDRLNARIRNMFPEAELALLHGVRDILAREFSDVFDSQVLPVG